MTQIATNQDLIVVALSLFLFPVFIGMLNFILTMLITKDVEKSFTEGKHLTIIMWVVVFFGITIAILI